MNMRRRFADLLGHEMQCVPQVCLITTDLGYGIWDEVRLAFPTRVFNTGAAEQAAAGIAVGLALSGRIPVLYSITPFLLYRPFELWKIYLEHERIPVKLVGSGRDNDYAHDGITHCATDDLRLLAVLPQIKTYRPTSDEELSSICRRFLYSPNPAYLNLRRA